ncbi:hypothetical protein [Oceanirhabdus sp. W0125-5]|uniref:hypothetical protein n=1 Tax=Oceanirhabdus sp. W0125-5 TaxID=2999116 RepID=UPI0022F2A4F3|nr:hypothetical protein [Oceanirhabdus sp. W0125-5]WBW99251.1 hypothetical protein OW730_11015 [Oceanirhabdus sp. W0125-5]
MKTKWLGREEILKSIVEVLEPLDYVYAMWQCGSAAFKRVDEWSDIDVVVDVEDDKVMEIFKFTDKALESLSPIEHSFECPQSMSPGAYQKVYKLENTSEFLVIEICAVKHSSKMKFLQKEIHGETFVHFDKCNVTDCKPINKKEFEQKLKNRIESIENIFNIYQFLVKKELNRKNYIEAIAFYQTYSLGFLQELIRIKYNPYRHSFRTRYVYYDLPEEVVNRLHNFYFIKDGEELAIKHQEVVKWFKETVNELKSINLEELL